jgi:hypothetical protein
MRAAVEAVTSYAVEDDRELDDSGFLKKEDSQPEQIKRLRMRQMFPEFVEPEV